MKSVLGIWLLVLFTAVPYGVYFLFVDASGFDYIWVSLLILLWIFGFWPVMTPIMTFYTLHQVYKFLRTRPSKDETIALMQKEENRDRAIEMISEQTGMPEFIVSRIYSKLHTQFIDIKEGEDLPKGISK